MRKAFKIVYKDGKYYVVDCDDGRRIYIPQNQHPKRKRPVSSLQLALRRLEKLETSKVYGFGINDADYCVKGCPFYSGWVNMLERCHSQAFQKRQPTYKGCQVCEEWRYFSNFKAWMEKQDWQGMHLDKDIIGNGKLYSPAMCRFVDQALNNLMNDSRKSRGPYPVGVSKSGKGYQAQCSRGSGINPYLGSYPAVKKAFRAYVVAKTEYVMLVAKKYDEEIQAGLGRFCGRLWTEYKTWSERHPNAIRLANEQFPSG